MPRSTNYFKKETIDYIVKNYSKTIKILDIGPGVGTYSNLLRPNGFINIDCIEIFEKYATDYNLKEKYNNVFIDNVVTSQIDFTNYDLIIFGDVLEHIDINDAKILFKKLNGIDMIVAVPFESHQDESFGNKNEIHLQTDLNFNNFFEKYEGFYPFCLRHDYGVFINKKQTIIYLETGEKEIPENYLELLNNSFQTLKKINVSTTDYSNSSEEFKNIKQQDVLLLKHDVTIVTGLWDMGRGKINSSFSRGYDSYLEKFSQLLKTEIPMYIFIDAKDEEFIWKYRKKENTVINKMTLDELKDWFNFTSKTNEIRKTQNWLNQASWLSESPQATLDSYNPVVMSKMFMLNNVTVWNPFHSEYFFWIDAGITNTVHYGYFTHDKVFEKLPKFINVNKDFVFISYPYEGGNEIHGFERQAIAKYSNTDYVKYVCRGGFFGGKKSRINEINGLYYSYLNSTLSEGFMGTEESIFTIIMHNHGDLITQYGISYNGMIWPFFEDLKDNEFKKNVLNKSNISNNFDINKVGLYVITFNSPKQFETLIQSMSEYDSNLIHKTKKFLLDNSTDSSTFSEYSELCSKYGFTHIKKDNLGICGGRQWIAEHFDKETDLDYYLFFEDDMFFYPNNGTVCRNGFNRYIENFYLNSLEIIHKENFDFLKLNYSEFFGDNGTQWSWYNVPQTVREEFWPEKPKLPVQGLDPNAPKTVYKNVLSHKGIPYVNGEVYYSNWPQIVSRTGNKKMFLDTTWARPFEQTWMSHMFQLVKKGELNPGLLLMTPTEHNRFEHYDRELRKES